MITKRVKLKKKILKTGCLKYLTERECQKVRDKDTFEAALFEDTVTIFGNKYWIKIPINLIYKENR